MARDISPINSQELTPTIPAPTSWPVELSNNKSSFNEYSLNTMNHLINVEKDYLKISNILSGIGRRFIRKISSNN